MGGLSLETHMSRLQKDLDDAWYRVEKWRRKSHLKGSIIAALQAERDNLRAEAVGKTHVQGEFAGQSIYVRGARSAIAQELDAMCHAVPVDRGEQMPISGERYLFCAGLIRQKPIAEQTEAEITETMMVNAISVIRECERLLAVNPKARICVIGSESAFKGSFDGAYAAAKAALHRYVETKRLQSPDQQLVCVAPTHILNTGMCNRRNADGVELMEKRRLEHQKQRWLQPIEVARLVHFLLCQDQGYLTNIVIRMNGGQNL